MNKRVVCIGGALVDELYYASEPMMHATTNMVAMEQSAGGVARNLAHQLSILGLPVSLIAPFGDDVNGTWLQQQCLAMGIDISAAAISPNATTGKYVGIINPDGSLYTALLASNCNHLVSPEHLEFHKTTLLNAAFIIADTNLSIQSLQWLTNFCRNTGVRLIIEPVSVPPAKKLQQVNLDGVFMITPNEDELPVLLQETFATINESIEALLETGVQNIWLHAGSDGSTLYNKQESFTVPAKKVQVKDSTGAGDGALAGFVFAQCTGMTYKESVAAGHRMAEEILQVKGAIAINVNPAKILNEQ